MTENQPPRGSGEAVAEVETEPTPKTRTVARPADEAPVAPIALTMGDPAGIGGEIALKAYGSGAVRHPFFVIDEPERLGLMGGVRVEEIARPADAVAVWSHALPVLRQDLSESPEPGIPGPRNARATIAAIERAVELALAGEAGAVVTNPINKKALYDGAGFGFPGHTEFLAELGGVERTVMMLAGPSLRVVPVTIHEPLAKVPKLLNTQLIVETAQIAAAALATDFGIAEPRLAVSGLNPHAGEGGAMGREEIDVIKPAIKALEADGYDVCGPLPADTMFHAAARRTYDVAITMYHDQGLIPIKALDFERGVNVTLGLPFIRTSPDHGTAYDIAGRGLADPTSLIEALNMAGDLAARRRANAVAD